MENEVQEFFKEFMKTNQAVAKHIPETIKSFMGLHDGIIKDGALSKKQKELIAVGIAIATRCKACIFMHTQAAVQAGATAEEILETASVSVLMGGGPAFTQVQEVLKVFDALGVKY